MGVAKIICEFILSLSDDEFNKLIDNFEEVRSGDKWDKCTDSNGGACVKPNV
jgi:hypothetical protein